MPSAASLLEKFDVARYGESFLRKTIRPHITIANRGPMLLNISSILISSLLTFAFALPCEPSHCGSC
jgi:hypothetical protein